MGIATSCICGTGGVKDEQHRAASTASIPYRKGRRRMEKCITSSAMPDALDSPVAVMDSSNKLVRPIHPAAGKECGRFTAPLLPHTSDSTATLPPHTSEYSEPPNDGSLKVAVPLLDLSVEYVEVGQEGAAVEENPEDLIKACPEREPRRPICLIDEAEKLAAPTGFVRSPMSEFLVLNNGKRLSWGAADVKMKTSTTVTVTISCLEGKEDEMEEDGDIRSTASTDSNTSSDLLSDGDSSDEEEAPPPPPLHKGTPIATLLEPRSHGYTHWPQSQITFDYQEGEGAQATVWSCRMGDSEPFCAKIARDGRGRAGIRREAELALSLDHPNVLSCYALVTDERGEVVGMATELMGGDDLLEALAPYNDPLPSRQRAQIASGIAQAMAHLHARKMVHRDIKPGNILLEKRLRRGRDGLRVVLADLGIACRMEDGQDYATVEDISGSLPYLDPALVKGKGEKRITAATDVFSYGMTLFHMVTQAVPFEGMDTATHMRLMLEGKRQSQLKRPEGCDDAWWQLIKRCTHPIPRMRLTVPQIMDKLEAILATA